MIRLQDIADMAGVSRTTVSNVINGNTKRVSQETIDKITRILKEQNYVPPYGLYYAFGTWLADHRRSIGICCDSWYAGSAGLLCGGACGHYTDRGGKKRLFCHAYWW